MSRLDRILRRYKERTTCEPSEPVELKVMARIRARAATSPAALMAMPVFRPAAMAVAMLMGVMTVGLVPTATSSASPVSDLSVFAPDAPHLPSTWLGRTK